MRTVTRPDAAGQESSPLSILIRSNAPWGLKIKCDLADGKMKEWTGTGYVTTSPKFLSRSLEWKLDGTGTYTPLSTTDAVLVASQPPTGESGAMVKVRFRQVISYDDLRPPNGNSYAISVIYTAVQNY